jgi:hypothetical protein
VCKRGCGSAMKFVVVQQRSDQCTLLVFALARAKQGASSSNEESTHKF